MNTYIDCEGRNKTDFVRRQHDYLYRKSQRASERRKTLGSNSHYSKGSGCKAEYKNQLLFYMPVMKGCNLKLKTQYHLHKHQTKKEILGYESNKICMRSI